MGTLQDDVRVGNAQQVVTQGNRHVIEGAPGARRAAATTTLSRGCRRIALRMVA